MLLSLHRAAIAALPAGELPREALLDGRFLLHRGAGYSVHYAPFDHVNTSARIALVGITPGWQQMRLGFETARDRLRAGAGDQAMLAAVKRHASFCGHAHAARPVAGRHRRRPRARAAVDERAVRGAHRPAAHDVRRPLPRAVRRRAQLERHAAGDGRARAARDHPHAARRRAGADPGRAGGPARRRPSRRRCATSWRRTGWRPRAACSGSRIRPAPTSAARSATARRSRGCARWWRRWAAAPEPAAARLPDRTALQDADGRVAVRARRPRPAERREGEGDRARAASPTRSWSCRPRRARRRSTPTSSSTSSTGRSTRCTSRAGCGGSAPASGRSPSAACSHPREWAFRGPLRTRPHRAAARARGRARRARRRRPRRRAAGAGRGRGRGGEDRAAAALLPRSERAGAVGRVRRAVHAVAARPAEGHRGAGTGGALADVVAAAAPPHAVAAALLRGAGGRRAGDPRLRGRPLGRRGDARRPAPARPAHRGRRRRSSSRATATTSSTARTAADPARRALAARDATARCGSCRCRRRRSRSSRRRTGSTPRSCTAGRPGTRSSSPRRSAAGGVALPATVRDAVLARVTPLSQPARRVLDGVAIVPGAVEPAAARGAGRRRRAHLEECLSCGVLGPAGAASRSGTSSPARRSRRRCPRRCAPHAAPAARSPRSAAARRPGPARLPRRGRRGRRGRAALRARRRRARGRRRRPPRGRRPVRARAALRRRPRPGRARRPARAPRARVLPRPTSSAEAIADARARARVPPRARRPARARATRCARCRHPAGARADIEEAEPRRPRGGRACSSRSAAGRELAMAYANMAALAHEPRGRRRRRRWGDAGARARPRPRRRRGRGPRARLRSGRWSSSTDGPGAARHGRARASRSRSRPGCDERVLRAYSNLAWAALRHRALRARGRLPGRRHSPTRATASSTSGGIYLLGLPRPRRARAGPVGEAAETAARSCAAHAPRRSR